jgi:hypothetical protein
MAAIETGEYQNDCAALACFKAYCDASDGELARLGVTRDDCLALAREYVGQGYNDTALTTMFERLITAFKLGKDR